LRNAEPDTAKDASAGFAMADGIAERSILCIRAAPMETDVNYSN